MQTLDERYPERRAFVTGAASGLGLALCRRLAASRWRVVMVDRSERLLPAAEEVEAAGAEVHAVRLDVTDADEYGGVVERACDRLGGMDLVFNNAGVAATGYVGEASLDDWRWQLDINLRGVLYGCHLFAPVLKAQGSGHIVNTGSMASLLPLPGVGPYCVSKAAVRALTDVLWGELSPHGVDVSVFMPEFFQTNLHEGSRGHVERTRKMIERSGRDAGDVAAYLLERMGKRDVHILYPPSMQGVWWVKRMLPTRALRFIRRQARRVEARRGG